MYGACAKACDSPGAESLQRKEIIFKLMPFQHYTFSIISVDYIDIKFFALF
jgi:hypothetical protein